MKEIDICNDCFQKERCGARGTLGPKSHEQLVYNSDMEPSSHFDCWFFSCREGHMKARQALRNAKHTRQTGLIQFNTFHKPFIDEGTLSGRYVTLGVKGFKDGDIVILSYNQIIPLASINHIPR